MARRGAGRGGATLGDVERVEILVSIADDWLERADEVEAALRRAGVEIDSRLEATGIIVGTATEDVTRGLGSIPGVAAVEVSRTFRIPGPDSPVQ